MKVDMKQKKLTLESVQNRDNSTYHCKFVKPVDLGWPNL